MEQENKSRILKAAGSVGLMTALSRVFGYVRDAALAWALGAGASMDAFTVAYRIANLFRRLVAEGAMSASFVPVFIQYRQDNSQEELWNFTRKFFYTLALITGLIVVLEIIFTPAIVAVMAPGFLKIPQKLELTIFLTRIMAPYLVFVSVTALFMGVLNSFGYFAVPALGPVFFNVALIASIFLSTRLMSNPVIGIAFGVVIGGIFQFVSQLPFTIQKGMRFQVGFSFKHPAVQKIGMLLAPSIFGIGIVQINVLVDSLLASLLREGSVSQIYYADRVMELVLGIFVVSMSTVILPEMSQSAAAKNPEELKRTLLFGLRTTSFISIPASVGLFFLANPIVHVLFEHGRFTSLDTERTAVALAYYAIGLYFMAAIRILVSAFYAGQDTRTPGKIAFVALIVNAVLDWILMHPLKQGGLALSTSITSALTYVQLCHAFQKRYGSFDWKKFKGSIIKTTIASLIMGVVCLVVLSLFNFNEQSFLSSQAMILLGTILLGVIVYLGVSFLLKLDELSFVQKIMGKLFQKNRKELS